MSAINDPIEVTVDKRGNIIILIDRHNLSAAEVLDMAARAMLAAGYEKSQILQAALAYGGKYAAAKDPGPVAAVAGAPPVVETEPSKAAPAETSESLAQKTPIIPPPLPAIEAPLKETVAAESKELPVLPALDKEPEKAEIKEIKESPAAPKAEEVPPVAEKTAILPAAIAPEPAPVALEPVAELPPSVPVVAPMEVKAEPAPVAVVMPPPLPIAPETHARIHPAVPVSVMATVFEKNEIAELTEKPSHSKMDEILAADRKRIQNLIAANGGTKPTSEPVPAAPVNHASVQAVIPPEPVVTIPATPEPDAEPEQATEIAAAQSEWQGQKFDPATSTSMLIPPIPGTFDDDAPESAAALDVPLSPSRSPKIPVSVVMPKAMAAPIGGEDLPKPPSPPPPPPAGGTVAPMSRITGFVKLNTIAIPHYQAEPVEPTLYTPKPMTPSVLSPQAAPAQPAKK